MQLTDQVCVLAFQDRSMRGTDSLLEPAETAQAVRGYIWNLVRPMAFTFLRDCVRIGGLRLSERIAVVIDTGTSAIGGHRAAAFVDHPGERQQAALRPLKRGQGQPERGRGCRCRQWR